MFRIFFKSAYRRLLNNRMVSIINSIGLSIGICVCLCVYLIVSFEYSFEDSVDNVESVYRLINNKTKKDGSLVKVSRLPYPAKSVIRNQTSGIDRITGFQILDINGTVTKIKNENTHPHEFFSSGEIAIADSTFFSFFKPKLLAGTLTLSEPYRLILTLNKAKKYFGDHTPEQYLGKRAIYLDSLSIPVTGIIEDWPANLSFDFNDIISEYTSENRLLLNHLNLNDWIRESETIILRLNSRSKVNDINRQLKDLLQDKLYKSQGEKTELTLQPLKDIHFDTKSNYEFEFPFNKTNKATMLALFTIAVFILLLAIVNFINLTIAQAFNRSKEIGVRKVLGASKRFLIFQILAETLIVTLFSVIISLFVVVPILYFFKDFVPIGVKMQYFSFKIYSFIFCLTVVVTFIGGLYPAIKFSYLNAVKSLKGGRVISNIISKLTWKSLIVFQFVISIAFIISSVFIKRQLNYIDNKGPGFDTENIFTFYPTNQVDSTYKIKAFAEKIRSIRGVKEVALQAFDPISSIQLNTILNYRGIEEKETSAAINYGNEHFIDIYGIPLIAGRNFISRDSSSELIINKSTSEMLGFKDPLESVGKTIYLANDPFTVVGVVNDFHQNSFYEPIKPMIIQNQLSRERCVAIKLERSESKIPGQHLIIDQIKKVYGEFFPNKEFNIRYLNESIQGMYEKEYRLFSLINLCVFISILISCMGLFGLSLFIAQRRAREVAIRKVLGASLFRLVFMLNIEFILLVVIAFLIASPISFYLMQQWLLNFVFHADISSWIFILSGTFSLLVAFITVSINNFKTAIANPTKCLKE